jgi:hypothetical protein
VKSALVSIADFRRLYPEIFLANQLVPQGPPP